MIPIIKFLIAPIVGFPFIANLYFLSPGKLEIDVNSSIASRSSLKYKTSDKFELLEIAIDFNRVSMSKEKSIEFESGSQT